jgi:hypothetical protein
LTLDRQRRRAWRGDDGRGNGERARKRDEDLAM